MAILSKSVAAELEAGIVDESAPKFFAHFLNVKRNETDPKSRNNQGDNTESSAKSNDKRLIGFVEALQKKIVKPSR